MQDNGWKEFYEMHRKKGNRFTIPDKACTAVFTQYIIRIQKKLSRLPSINKTRQAITENLDLLKAIDMYRKEPDKEVFLTKYSEFEDQVEYIDVLWREFTKHTPDEMYDLVYTMIIEIDELLGGTYLD